MIYWTLFSMGLLGSLHCLGMCGPIVMSMSMNTPRALIYNAGRISTYMLIGILFGLIGKTLVLAGFQQYISIFIGATILTYLLVRYTPFIPLTDNPLIMKLIRYLHGILPKPNSKALSFLPFGMVNGLLPCGLVYLAAITSIGLTGPVNAAIGMLSFGVGTLPVMMLVPYIKRNLNYMWSQKVNKLIPAFLFVFAVLFILRGMDLGIPYISPELAVTSCH